MKRLYQTYKNATSYIKYHFVFCTRYRRKIFNIPGLEKRFIELLEKGCKDKNIELDTVALGEDHVYISAISNPKISPSEIMNYIKTTTSPILRKEFEELNKMTNLWTRAYLVSTEEDIKESTIEEFVTAQKTRP